MPCALVDSSASEFRVRVVCVLLLWILDASWWACSALSIDHSMLSFFFFAARFHIVLPSVYRVSHVRPVILQTSHVLPVILQARVRSCVLAHVARHAYCGSWCSRFLLALAI